MSPYPERQRVERASSGRRARLTPVEGSDPSPEAPVRDETPAGPAPAPSGNDDRLRRERPPHW
ncbi:hypothetical protein MN032_17290 [Agromyces atrinae]|uniref:hypothetical protein n=1 Tax=Agromyces atrinae TaxID=592376 RepID=UPI001F563C68|nr:hypothetical protein [Agromyces atrinae]MCI2959441.1 hypothetical protein [Agromyces atrinae]